MILNTVEQYLTLEQDRLSHQQIVEKIEAFRSPFGEGTLPPEPGLSEYIRYRLSIEDPAYLTRGTRLFNKTLSTASGPILTHESL